MPIMVLSSYYTGTGYWTDLRKYCRWFFDTCRSHVFTTIWYYFTCVSCTALRSYFLKGNIELHSSMQYASEVDCVCIFCLSEMR